MSCVTWHATNATATARSATCGRLERMGSGWHSVGDYVRRRRIESKLSRAQFAERLGISLRTLDNIENAERDTYRRDTIVSVEAGMMWQPGSVAAVVAGGQPSPLHDGEWERLRRVWPRLPIEARRMLVALAESAGTRG